MLTEKFDAYGEVLPVVAREKREAAKPASVLLGRIGQYLFWSLVVIILSARIAYYPANPASEFRTASESRQTVTR
jgi:prolipoprotein diacylglyceryltransferase